MEIGDIKRRQKVVSFSISNIGLLFVVLQELCTTKTQTIKIVAQASDVKQRRELKLKYYKMTFRWGCKANSFRSRRYMCFVF